MNFPASPSELPTAGDNLTGGNRPLLLKKSAGENLLPFQLWLRSPECDSGSPDDYQTPRNWLSRASDS